MTEQGAGHHDLCFLSDPPSEVCICERLKQAENYASIASWHTVEVDSYEQGQRDAIAAAVQRVEALEYDPDSGVDWNWDYDIDPTGMTRNPLVWIREAVAAIKNEVK